VRGEISREFLAVSFEPALKLATLHC
jgi:hypothetical protein